MTRKLLVIPADRISDWIEKGEVLARYHNPGEVFDEIHLLLLHKETPDPAALQLMAGRARVIVHSHTIPESFFTKTLGWQPFLTDTWEKKIIPLVRQIMPNVVRCYGAHLNLNLARRIKHDLAIPYIVSLHINPEINIHKASVSLKDVITVKALAALETRGLRHADLIMPVYRPIIPYLERRKLMQYKVHYNMVHQDVMQQKEDYSLHRPVRILCIGRQFEDKDPSLLMRAVASRDDTQMTIVGKGPIHQDLVTLAQKIGREGQFIFKESIPNEQLCAEMHSYDIMALHSEYFELSKVMIEGMLVGLPLLLNYRSCGDQVPELSDEICLRVPNTEEGYISGLNRLINDEDYRLNLGHSACRHASAHWSLEQAEEQYKNTYLQFAGGA